MGQSASKYCLCRKKSDTFSYVGDSSSDRSSIIELQTMQNPKVAAKPVSRNRFPGATIDRVATRLRHQFMWCFEDEETTMTRMERTVKATLLIQQWYRRYMARLEIRRRYTWTIFQSIEYAGEQDQSRLYNFFNALMTHILKTDGIKRTPSRNQSIGSMEHFEDESDIAEEDLLDIDDRDQKFHVRFPMVEEDLAKILDLYRKKRHYRLHAKYVAQILKEATKHLCRLPNLNIVSTAHSNQITVCGDLHGKLDDLFVIFYKNGLPSAENPYIFNGDFVDRGRRGLEVLLILLSCMLVYPGGVYLNRGNHEDYMMNQRYGFLKEVQSKYRKNSEKLMKLIEDVYRWLPLGAVVNNRALIVHGGISDTTDLECIKALDRSKYTSLLRPPIIESLTTYSEPIDKAEWKQVFDILWSDPQTSDGCIPNQLRGAGTYFGPDVTKKFLEVSKLSLIVRSHECKAEGYEMTHNDKVTTIFSASNYYEIGSNKGAYVKMVGSMLDRHFVQYMATTARTKKLTFHQKIGLVETSAIKELHGQIMAKKDRIEEEFALVDPEGTGFISINTWCNIMGKCLNLGLPWRMLREKLVTLDQETQQVKYSSTFENITVSKSDSVQGGATVVETLYRNKATLEAIFRIIDKDNSGYITLDEFSDACSLIKEYMPSPITQDQCEEICKLMDINKDGKIDLNEFLETFRMVDPESRRQVQAQALQCERLREEEELAKERESKEKERKTETEEADRSKSPSKKLPCEGSTNNNLQSISTESSMEENNTTVDSNKISENIKQQNAARTITRKKLRRQRRSTMEEEEFNDLCQDNGDTNLQDIPVSEKQDVEKANNQNESENATKKPTTVSQERPNTLSLSSTTDNDTTNGVLGKDQGNGSSHINTLERSPVLSDRKRN